MDNENILIVRNHSFTYQCRRVFDLGKYYILQKSCRETIEAYFTSNVAMVKAQDTFCSNCPNTTSLLLPLMGREEASKPHKQALGRVRFEMDEGFAGFLPEHIPLTFLSPCHFLAS